jgi:hypothetical protein
MEPLGQAPSGHRRAVSVGVRALGQLLASCSAGDRGSAFPILGLRGRLSALLALPVAAALDALANGRAGNSGDRVQARDCGDGGARGRQRAS